MDLYFCSQQHNLSTASCCDWQLYPWCPACGWHCSLFTANGCVSCNGKHAGISSPSCMKLVISVGKAREYRSTQLWLCQDSHGKHRSQAAPGMSCHRGLCCQSWQEWVTSYGQSWLGCVSVLGCASQRQKCESFWSLFDSCQLCLYREA